MSPASHFQDILFRTAWWALFLALGLGGWLFMSAWSIPAVATMKPAADEAGPSVNQRQPSHAVVSVDWSVFQSLEGNLGPGTSSLAARFRLAGTFFAYSEGVREGTNDTRKAILDDLRAGAQRIISESERIGEIEVVKIFRDRVILRDSVGEEQLWLSFSRTGPTRGAPAGTNGTAVATSEIPVQANRFGGSQVGENRWVFNRQALLDYYQELRDEPERLVKVFDSLKPVYGENRRITGYRLGIEGEREFFDASGLKEGDVVRSVNHMKMENRLRAEFLITQFIMDQANGFLFEVERDGQPVNLTYEVR